MGLTISLVVCGWIADKILVKKVASKNFVRKSFVAVGEPVFQAFEHLIINIPCSTSAICESVCNRYQLLSSITSATALIGPSPSSASR